MAEGINCFGKHGFGDLQKRFDDNVEAALKEGKTEKQFAREIILSEHEKLHNDMEGLKKNVLKNYKPQPYSPHDNTKQIEKINADYEAKINAAKSTAEVPVQTKDESGTTETINQDQPAAGEAEPPKPPAETVVPGQDEGNRVGVSHESLTKLSKKLGLQEPERGTFLTPEEQSNRGKLLIDAGADPIAIGEQFKKDKLVNPDRISVARAHYEGLTKTMNEAGDKLGTKSDEYKKAHAEWLQYRDEVVKPMGTASGASMSSLQGERDIDTGSFTAVKRAFEESTGKQATPGQEKQIKELSGKVKKLSQEVDKLKEKLTETLNKGEKEATPKKGIKESAKELADKIRENAKLHKPGSFSAATPASLVWDSAVEVVAKTVEAGGTIIQAIQRGIENIKESDWYKSLSKDEKKKAEDEFSDFHIGQQDTDIFTRIANKKEGSKFTLDEVNAIWNHAKSEYLDKGNSFDEMISKTSVDLGINPTQVRDALTTPKGARQITDAMYKKQNERNMAIRQAKDWATAAKSSPIGRFLKAIPRFFFALKVFGHGTVGMVTHAGINIYDPVEWKRYWPTFFKQFSFAYGSTANYEKAMQDLQNDPQFVFWKRNGLAVDPTTRYDEYQYITNMFNKMGRVGKWLTAGDRGFNALKVYRLQRAKALWEGSSNVEQADPETPKEIAKLVNHSSGTTGLKISDAANVAFFAPNLELSRWNKLIVDPAKAVKTFTNWNNATSAEKVAAKIVAQRAGRILATYVGALAVNQGLLSLSGSNQKINLFNPMDSDWLKFKSGGRTIDLTGGMVSLLGFLTRMGHTAFASSKDLKNKSRKDEAMNQVWSYGSGKLSPFASTAKDVVTHHDFKGNTLPFYNDKPVHSWNKKLSWSEYLTTQQTPIPVAEAFTDIHKQMEDAGVPKPTIGQLFQGIFIGAMVGGTGVHVGEEPQTKPTPFNDEDKKDPTFKFFLDKGMELPNTALTSETVKDISTKTIKKISDYPKDVQDKYSQSHKEYLKQELAKIKNKGYVFVNEYGQASINPAPHAKRVRIGDLNEKQLASILSISQSQATTKAKHKVFNQ